MRYWTKHISNDLPPPEFLFNKASPLSAAFSKLADQSWISSHLPEFCSKANLLCFPDKANYATEDRVRRDHIGNKYYATEDRVRRDRIGNKYYATEENVVASSGKKVNKWVVEPGRFFRESVLKAGAIMPMPDIRDKMPKRSFLPRLIVSKLPFSTSKLADLRRVFHAVDDSGSMAKMLTDSLEECERAPSPGEAKRCVASIEDMIDFATSVLGPNVAALTTESARGYNGEIRIGKVKAVNGGRLTKSVTCHQSLFPYMLYYCHSVPKVRVYEADILDPKSESRINRGVAICHVDTSSWSPGHEAFVSLGSGPGKIAVCHWVYENGLTWAIAD
ncbi:polygalacturonase-1 non-catalytic subunit beta-like [Salvia splendens]|nr:polygalacturonase-1 non-catalytic subunit beta-like [Salvia splendens]